MPKYALRNDKIVGQCHQLSPIKIFRVPFPQSLALLLDLAGGNRSVRFRVSYLVVHSNRDTV